MKITTITNEQEYQNALSRLEVLFDAKFGSNEGDELENLSLLLDKYESENFDI